MKRYSPTRLRKVLTQYIDGELSDQRRKELDAYIAADKEAARLLAEMMGVRELVRRKSELPPDIGFWTRLSARIEERESPQKSFLPIPRKLVPAVVTAGVVMMATISFFLYQNGQSVLEYVSRQSDRVQHAYQQSVLQGKLLPVFDALDKNQVLQFALFGTLPLDAHAQSALTVDESAEKGYRIDVGRSSVKNQPPVTVSELMREVNPTTAQRELIDSLLEFGRQQIESSVFVSENRAVAIDPFLPRLNRVILSSIAASLEPPQRVRFERFLQSRNVPYMLTSFEGRAANPESIYQSVKRTPRSDQFLVMTPDTVALALVEVNLDSLREATLQLRRLPKGWESHVQTIVQNVVERSVSRSFKLVEQLAQFEIEADADVIKIRVPGSMTTSHPELRTVVVRPRIPQRPPVSSPSLRPFLNFRYATEDSGMKFEMQIDSVMVRFFREVPESFLRLEEMDSQFEMNERTKESLRDVMREAFQQHHVDFDSLRHQIRKWMIAPPQNARRAPRERSKEDQREP